ncbi:MAG: hypothetical protein SCALA702_22810 [Melioribacteraceae bacterium]|nr:MAG: hypothetical protein SCALA702_22810 [Melioribacteraceae bacterium]
MIKKSALFLTFILLVSSIIVAQDESKSKLNSSTLSGLKFRSIGPALTSGRISDFAVNESNPAEYFTAVASGGVWKTTNYGATWTPVFDSQGSYSIGCVTMDQSNTNVVWVGTGENNSQRSVAYGDGVYLSLDGGKSWKNKGLKESEHIAKIVIHPEDSRVVYVAAQGPLWGPGGDRGLYKTTDMGETWEKVLEISEHTGVTDIVMDPRDPDVIYAAAYQRRRHVFTLINGGPESAIYKTTNGGESWDKLKSGLPSTDLGRVGLAISPVNPDYVYAIVEAAEGKGGFFRTTNRGATWEKRDDYVARSPQYYQEIVCDPVNVDKVYSLDTYSKYTLDGGKTWTNIGNRYRHVDDHAFWVNPKNTDQVLIGGDGGVYYSFDGMKNWEFIDNLPIVQYYKVAVDNSLPFYYVYGGTQDNNSMGGPSRTTSASGIINTDWFITNGGDGFEAAVDPEDPNIVYTQSQYGWLTRFNRATGEKVGIKPHEGMGEEPYRWNWDAPLIISPHKNTRLYFAANKLFKSEDRGDSWEVISPDLTQQIDRNKLEVMGKVWSMDAVSKNASTSLFGNIVALAESPVKEGVLFVGTDDGLLHISEDGGQNWRKISSIEGIPDMSYVNDIIPSHHNANRVYVAFNHHKYADFKPYVVVSEDLGKSWKKIVSDLPERGSVYALDEDHVNENLLFAGTEFGFYYSPDRGEKWIKLSAGLPTISIRDIEIQRRENDIVLASFGRSFYIMDDYTPLREISESKLEEEFVIFPIKDAPVYVVTYPLGGRKQGSQGDGYYTADNPPYGATFTYYMKESISTIKKDRKKKEKDLIKNEKPVPFPSNNELVAEDNEEKPFLIFTVKDASGNVVRRLKASASSGLHRLTWDLRYMPTYPLGEQKGYLNNDRSGILAMTGKYTVEVSQSVNGDISALHEPVEFNLYPLGIRKYSEPERKEMLDFQMQVAELGRAAYGTQRLIRELDSKIQEIRTALKFTPDATEAMMEKANMVEDSLRALSFVMNGNSSFSKRNMNQYPSIMDRIGVMGWEMSRSLTKPTKTHRDVYAVAKAELAPVISQVESLVNKEIKELEDSLEALGAPWTKGRIPKMK